MVKKLTERHVAHIRHLEKNGRTTPNKVLVDAKRKTSPLHNLYNWDVKRAAEEHWLDRTREILQLVQVIEHTETETHKVHYYVRDPGVPGHEQGYIAVPTLRVDPELARRALITEFGRVSSALERARSIAGGLGMVEEIDGLLANVAGLRAIISVDTAA